MKLYKDSIKSAVRAFKNHKARYSKGVFFDVLDWKHPDTMLYWVRMVFDHERNDTNAVYITGDLGSAVVYPTCCATLRSMAMSFTFGRSDGLVDINVNYFLEKVKTGSRLYDWGMVEFKDDLREKFVNEYGKDESQEQLDEFFDEYCDSYRPGVEVNNNVHFTDPFAKDALEKIFPDCNEWIWECGQRVSPYVVFWLVAMRMAYEQTKDMKDGEK
jgi:hypothetical protein